MNFFEKKLEKVWRYQKNIYLCSPVRKTDINKFIEKTDLLYKKQVPRKNNLSRSVNSFERIIKCRNQTGNIEYYTMKSLILAQDER